MSIQPLQKNYWDLLLANQSTCRGIARYLPTEAIMQLPKISHLFQKAFQPLIQNQKLPIYWKKTVTIPDINDRITDFLSTADIVNRSQVNEHTHLATLSKQIKTFINKKEHTKEMLGMENLGDSYFRKKEPRKLIQAAGIYNYAYRIAIKLSEKDKQSQLLSKLFNTEKKTPLPLPPSIKNQP